MFTDSCSCQFLFQIFIWHHSNLVIAHIFCRIFIYKLDKILNLRFSILFKSFLLIIPGILLNFINIQWVPLYLLFIAYNVISFHLNHWSLKIQRFPSNLNLNHYWIRELLPQLNHILFPKFQELAFSFFSWTANQNQETSMWD